MQGFTLNTRQVGYIIIALSILFGAIVFLYTQTINEKNALLHESCPLPDDVCPYNQIPTESVLGGILAALLFAFGVFLVYTYKDAATIISERKGKADNVAKTLEGDERRVYNLVMESDGAIYQHEIVTKTGMTKVKVTRILDFLEARGLVERKRRGMSNLVVLKQV